MTKGYGYGLSQVVNAILLDCLATFPGDRQELLRDQARLSFLVEKRGHSVFTLDLPALGKHFDRCLAEGTYTKPELPLSGPRWNWSPIPKLFSGLVLRVFDKDGMLRFNADVNAIAALRQLYFFSKKLKIDCERRKHFNAVQTFFDIEESLRGPSLNWEEPWSVATEAPACHFADGYSSFDSRSPDSVGRREDLSRLDRLQRVADIVSTSLGEFSPREWRSKHGPGAVSDQKQGENKYAFPTWTERLESVFSASEFAHANYGLWADSALEQGGGYDDEPSSKLISVPKTQKGPRLIAAEPVAHQWCQQIIWDYLEERVRSIFLGRSISFRDQSGNQRLALSSSETGSHWTVDLSSASDYLSLWSIERLFKQNQSLLAALAASRTRFLRQDIDKKSPSVVELKKFSTMGSACTFPVQSIFFLTVSLAAVLEVENKSVTRSNLKKAAQRTRVFGDDIIIPEEAGDTLLWYLSYLGCVVNFDKTCRNGNFRESCGVEAFRGYDVTPAYVTVPYSTRKPESVLSNLEQSNNFFLKGWWKASEVIKQAVAAGPWPVVHVSQGVAGWKSFVGSKDTGRTRYNATLQRTEYRTMKLSASSAVTQTNNQTALLQYFTERPDPELPWVSGVKQRPRLKIRRGWEDVAALG